jgi:hypothetical protein
MEQQTRAQDTLYSSLDPESRQIRLFTLLPGAFQDPIKGFLTLVSLESNPDYEALSYVWGDPTVTLLIHIAAGGLDSSGYFEAGVTTNLESALRHLRLKDVPRCLWVDAICINQLDVLERNQQVKIMKWVYEGASRVLIWLGKAKVHSYRGLKLLSAMLRENDAFEGIENNRSQTFTHFCISDILNRDYWQRIWIIQEVALAKELLLICGTFSAEIPASGGLGRMIRNLQSLDGKPVAYDRSDSRRMIQAGLSITRLLRILQIREYRQASQVPFLWQLVWQFRHCKSHDSRDLVFGLAGLATASDNLDDKPDYTLNIEMVKYRLVHTSILRQANLNILNCASVASNIAKSPSWIFDLSKTDLENAWEELCALPLVSFESARHSRFRKFDASKQSCPQVIPGPAEDFRLLTVRGFLIDSIEYLGTRSQYNPLQFDGGPNVGQSLYEGSHTHSDNITDMFQQPVIKEWREYIISNPEPKKETPCAYSDTTTDAGLSRMREAFWRTLTADSIFKGAASFGVIDNSSQIQRGVKPKKAFGQVADLFTVGSIDRELENIKSNKKLGPLASDDFLRAVEVAIGPRQFFQCRKGWIGLGPPAAVKEDMVCILLGGATPFVLRPLGRDRYRLVGECYVHGIMDGEAMDDLSNREYELRDITLV